MILNRRWFDGAINVNTPFGYDCKTFPSNPRIHLGQDYAPLNGKRESTIAHTIISGKVQWHVDGQGNSILRQIWQDIEARYYHFRRDELTSDIIAALTVPGTIVEPGTAIGPAGNVGLKVAGNGNDGSHVHLVIVSPSDKIVRQLIGSGWDVDASERYMLKYGDRFTDEALEWRVRWMNDRVIYRFDPMSQKYAYFLNPKVILGA